MAGNIEMVPEGISLSNSPESTVQSGGGGGMIDIWGTQVPLSHTPLSTTPKGGGGEIDMVGAQGLLSTTPTPPMNMQWPADKGK